MRHLMEGTKISDKELSFNWGSSLEVLGWTWYEMRVVHKKLTFPTKHYLTPRKMVQHHLWANQHGSVSKEPVPTFLVISENRFATKDLTDLADVRIQPNTSVELHHKNTSWIFMDKEERILLRGTKARLRIAPIVVMLKGTYWTQSSCSIQIF